MDSGAGLGSLENYRVPKIIAQLENRREINRKTVYGKTITQSSTVCILLLHRFSDGVMRTKSPVLQCGDLAATSSSSSHDILGAADWPSHLVPFASRPISLLRLRQMVY